MLAGGCHGLRVDAGLVGDERIGDRDVSALGAGPRHLAAVHLRHRDETIGAHGCGHEREVALDHVGVVADDSPLVPELLTWTEQRFSGQVAADTCD